MRLFGIAGPVAMALSSWFTPLPTREDIKADWEQCDLCRSVFEDQELIMACEYTVVDWEKGIVVELFLKRPELMTRFRAISTAFLPSWRIMVH